MLLIFQVLKVVLKLNHMNWFKQLNHKLEANVVQLVQLKDSSYAGFLTCSTRKYGTQAAIWSVNECMNTIYSNPHSSVLVWSTPIHTRDRKIA